MAVSASVMADLASARAVFRSVWGSPVPGVGLVEALGWDVGAAVAPGVGLAGVAPGSWGVVEVPLAAPASPSTTCSPVVAPESPPKTWSRASRRVSAKPTLSPKETRTLRSSGYCVPVEDWTYTGWT